MQNTPITGPPSPSDRVGALVEALLATLRLARVLAQSHRRIDLAGLDQEIGRLCAAALDLPPAEGQAMRPKLADGARRAGRAVGLRGGPAGRPDMRRAGIAALLLLLPSLAAAQSVSIDLGAAGGAGATSRLVQLTALITVLALAPSLLVMVTAFTRIVVVLSLLRSALGTQGAPPNTVLIGLALFLTFFVMQPVLDQAWTTGLVPMNEGRVSEMEGLRLAAEPFRRFMAGSAGPRICGCSSTSAAWPTRPDRNRRRGAP